MTEPDFQGELPNPEQTAIIDARANHWREVANEAPVQAIARIEDAAKQIIGITGILQGLYFAVYSFGEVGAQIGVLDSLVLRLCVLLIFLLPILFWLISLYCATQVFVPRTMPKTNLNDISAGAWQNVQKSYEDAQDYKLKWLRLSHRWLISSFAVVILLLAFVVALPSTSGTEPVEVLIVTPSPTLSLTPTP